MKRIHLGGCDFKEVIDGNYYFIDKTLIIKDFLEDSGKIVLLPRPRRFGKTFNLSILKYFLEKCDEDRTYLFSELKIEKEQAIMEKQGSYPVIHLTFKDEKHGSYEKFMESMGKRMAALYQLFYKVMADLTFEHDKRYFEKIMNESGSEQDLEESLLRLSKFLSEQAKQKVIILIDEYDTPIHEAYFNGYYPKMVEFMRHFLSASLKDNIYLEKAMITGILRVAKESIFSGLNNLEVYSLLGERYSQYFGFTEEETRELLAYYHLEEKLADFRAWYNGYKFGKTIIYNPWSVLSYINKPDREFMPYWVNTSENKLIKSLLAEGDDEVKLGLETLYRGGVIETTINEDVVMSEMDGSQENVWSFLLLLGYLKPVGKRLEGRKYYYQLAIPNEEMTCLYESIIEKWFREGFISSDYTKMLKALVGGEVELFEEYFSSYMLKSFSYFDLSGENPERVYHAFILGLLVSLGSTHEVLSNRESGLGRYDVCLVPKISTGLGIIMEFKSIRINSKMTLEQGMEKALVQIDKKLYDTDLRQRGIKRVMKLGLVFKGKEVLIKEGSC